MCTRVVYSGSNGMVATGRSMDWKTDMHQQPLGVSQRDETERRNRRELAGMDFQIR